MTAAAARIAARAVAQCEHVFGDLLVDAEAARWAARIEAEFLAEAGWRAVRRSSRPWHETFICRLT